MTRVIPGLSDIPLHGWPPYAEVHRERVRAHAKHDSNGGSMERKAWDNPAWLPVVMEELGEVAKVHCEYDLANIDRATKKAQLRDELVQVAAMVCAWLDALEEVEYRS
jgi:NTP pyrophosphatase (non-canonical NTP hydrolase)